MVVAVQKRVPLLPTTEITGPVFKDESMSFTPKYMRNSTINSIELVPDFKNPAHRARSFNTPLVSIVQHNEDSTTTTIEARYKQSEHDRAMLKLNLVAHSHMQLGKFKKDPMYADFSGKMKSGTWNRKPNSFLIWAIRRLRTFADEFIQRTNSFNYCSPFYYQQSWMDLLVCGLDQQTLAKWSAVEEINQHGVDPRTALPVLGNVFDFILRLSDCSCG